MSAEIVAKSWSVDWVERATGRVMNEGQRRSVDVISSVERPYNLPLINGGWSSAADYSIDLIPYYDIETESADDHPPTPGVVFHPEFLVVRLRTTWSTYDCSRLTELVLAAHAALVRVQVGSSLACIEYGEDETTGHGYQPVLEIQLNARKPADSSTSLYERHPGRSDLARRAVEKMADLYPAGTPT